MGPHTHVNIETNVARTNDRPHHLKLMFIFLAFIAFLTFSNQPLSANPI